jgi:hypothetical protein
VERVFEALWLFRVNRRVKVSIEKSRGEVNLMALPVPNSKQNTDQPQGF